MREFLDRVAGYLAAKVILGFLCWFYFRVVHRKEVEIIGKGNIPRGGRVLFYANHPSMRPFFVIVFVFPSVYLSAENVALDAGGSREFLSR